tara:strand:+ start:1621 stop:1932 length:312 start_codon:yes stop_codon:yes gene_type:complete
LLGLLPELECIVMNPFCLVSTFLLQPLALAADCFEVLKRLSTIGLMQLSLLAFELHGLLFQLLAALLRFLLQLLAACCELLLLLGQFGLHLLFQCRPLLTRCF